MNNDIHRIAKHNGLHTILNQTTEECAELIQAISKFNRVQRNELPESERAGILVNIVEELADVSIMIEQILYWNDWYKVVDSEKRRKNRKAVKKDR